MGDDRDFEASWKGLQKRYDKDRVAWEAKTGEQKEQLDELGQKFQEFENNLSTSPQPEPEPQKEAPVEQVDDDTPDVLSVVAEAEAIRNRDALLFKAVAQHPVLAQFRDNIPVVPPTLNDDGTVDNSGQQKAIDDFAAAIQGVGKVAQQANQQAVTQGWTPGVSPGAPTEETWDDQVNEYYKLKEYMGGAEMQELSSVEQSKISDAYYALHDKVGKRLPHQSAPWMDTGELAEAVRQVQAKVDHLGNFMMPKT